MIKDIRAWENWEKEFKKKEPVNPELNFKIFDSMVDLARQFHLFPPQDPLEGLEVKIRLAQAINVSKAA